MRIAGRVAGLLAVFLGVALVVTKLIMAHSTAAGAAEPEVRLAAAAGGLFAGSAAALLAGIAMAMAIARRK